MVRLDLEGGADLVTGAVGSLRTNSSFIFQARLVAGDDDRPLGGLARRGCTRRSVYFAASGAGRRRSNWPGPRRRFRAPSLVTTWQPRGWMSLDTMPAVLCLTREKRASSDPVASIHTVSPGLYSGFHPSGYRSGGWSDL